VFVDAGLSGKRADNRPGLQEALKAVQEGDALVVYSLSRLAIHEGHHRHCRNAGQRARRPREPERED